MAELGDVAEDLARAQLPADILDAVILSSMVALSKPDGGARGIATGMLTMVTINVRTATVRITTLIISMTIIAVVLLRRGEAG